MTASQEIGEEKALALFRLASGGLGTASAPARIIGQQIGSINQIFRIEFEEKQFALRVRYNEQNFQYERGVFKEVFAALLFRQCGARQADALETELASLWGTLQGCSTVHEFCTAAHGLNRLLDQAGRPTKNNGEVPQPTAKPGNGARQKSGPPAGGNQRLTRAAERHIVRWLLSAALSLFYFSGVTNAQGQRFLPKCREASCAGLDRGACAGRGIPACRRKRVASGHTAAGRQSGATRPARPGGSPALPLGEALRDTVQPRATLRAGAAMPVWTLHAGSALPRCGGSLPELLPPAGVPALIARRLKLQAPAKTPCRHSREGGNPFLPLAQAVTWFPAFAGTTPRI